jgi:transcriptional regulator GlxA family with amidase domain
MEKKTIAILLFDDVEVLDFAGPFEVFSVTNELNDHALFNVITVALKEEVIRARNGLSVHPDYSLESCPKPDILIVPGGLGTRPLLQREDLMRWITETAEQAELVLSVCTGSLLLAQASVLSGMKATTHHRALDLLSKIGHDVEVLPGERFVDNGPVITSAGISAGIDMSLYVISRLLGEEQARRTANYMEYDWPKKP